MTEIICNSKKRSQQQEQMGRYCGMKRVLTYIDSDEKNLNLRKKIYKLYNAVRILLIEKTLT